MSRIHSNMRTEPKPGYTCMSDLGPVPAGPRVQRTSSRTGQRSGHENSARVANSRQDYGSSIRRPAPVPDHRGTKRQIDKHIGQAKHETKKSGISRSSYCQPKTPILQDYATELRCERSKYQGKQEDLDETSSSNHGRSPSQVQNHSPERSQSPGLFIEQEVPSLVSSVDDEEDDAYEELEEEGDVEYNNDKYASMSEGDIIRAPTPPDNPLQDDEPGICQCPISQNCSQRANHLIDCRALVPEREWSYYTNRAVHVQLNMQAIPGVAEFVTVARVRDVLRYCRFFKGNPPGHFRHRENFWSMVVWAAEVRIRSITQAVLDSTQALVQLQEFLVNPLNPREHLQKGTPNNVREDIRFIYDKWSRGDLLGGANRGLQLVMQMSARERPVARLRIDDGWEHRMHDNFYGHGHLINGQRWANRLGMSRDGAHGPLIAGIARSIKDGARSIVMGLHYANVDKGNKIRYIGTALEAEGNTEATNIKDTPASRNCEARTPTYHTRMLLKSIQTQLPV